MLCAETPYFSVINLHNELDERWRLFILASEFVDGAFKFFEIERNVKNNGRKPFDLKDMIKLMYFASIDKIESTVETSKRAKYDIIYRTFCHEITPSDRSIRDYRGVFSVIYQLILSFILIVARETGLSSFKFLAVDGTIKIACNSPFNTIKQEDIHLLIKHYMVEELTKKEVKKLRKPAKKFLYNNKILPDDKINILFYWYDLLELTGQDSLPLHDIDARWMRTKDKGQKYKKLAYNVQVCTDTESKLICGIHVVQYPTDHNQIPELVEQTIQNLDKIPSKICADTIYGTLANLFYLKQRGISARIPTREQNKTLNDNLSENKYSKDYFVFDKNRNVYICPEKQELTVDGVYDAPMEKGGFNKKKIIYSNYSACKNCPHKSECTKSQHRTITRYTHELSYEVEVIMDTPEGQEDYKKRSETVEAHNGTFQHVYHYDDLQVVGLENTQNLMFKIVIAYNTIRIGNILREKGIDFYDFIGNIRFIASRGLC